MRGVTVTATSTVPGTTAAAATVTTGVTGTFRLNVPFGSYTIAASAANHVFGYPATGQVVNVAPGQSVNFGAIRAKSAVTNDGSNQRVVIQVSPAALNGTSVWFVAEGGSAVRAVGAKP